MMKPFRILTVCTGNICRSPLAEFALKHELRGLPVEVESAGTRAMVGRGMDPQNVEIAKSYGIPGPYDHSARQATAEMLRDFDLIIAMAREHRKWVVETAPQVTRKAFTLRELARLAESMGETPQDSVGNGGIFGSSVHPLVEQFLTARAQARSVQDANGDDVVDPYRREPEIFTQQAEQLIPAVEAVSKRIDVNFNQDKA